MTDRRKVYLVTGAIVLCVTLAEVAYLTTHDGVRKNAMAEQIAAAAVLPSDHPLRGRVADAGTAGGTIAPVMRASSAVADAVPGAATQPEGRVPRGDNAPLENQYAEFLGGIDLDSAQRANFLRLVAAFRFADDSAGQDAARSGLQRLLTHRFAAFERFERERPVREVIASFSEFAASRGVTVTAAERARIAAAASATNASPPTAQATLERATGTDGQFSLVRHAEQQIADSYALYDTVSEAAQNIFSREQRAALDVYLGERILEDEAVSRASAVVGGMLLETNRFDLRTPRP